jgi:hypothetical protein
VFSTSVRFVVAVVPVVGAFESSVPSASSPLDAQPPRRTEEHPQQANRIER